MRTMTYLEHKLFMAIVQDNFMRKKYDKFLAICLSASKMPELFVTTESYVAFFNLIGIIDPSEQNGFISTINYHINTIIEEEIENKSQHGTIEGWVNIIAREIEDSLNSHE